MTKIRGRVKELWLDFLYDIAGGFLQAVALHCFIDSIDIAPGGATGLAILLNRFTDSGTPSGVGCKFHAEILERFIGLAVKGDADPAALGSCSVSPADNRLFLRDVLRFLFPLLFSVP